MFSFKLSDWQELAINALNNKNHCLVTAPTGSGKTVPAEYAIKYFTDNNKKVIYTSPIKALSNQKYHEFQQKFPDISFGLLTGDIKDNPSADVLIMTTEILCNYLYNHKSTIPLDFNIDLDNELGCVIFDEVHYINDPDRGTVWEESIILLPPHIQMVMLSATLDNPIVFASWIEKLNPNKKVVICNCSIRSVPLKHYLWFNTSAQLIDKKINDVKFKSLVTDNSNKLLTLYENNTFNDKTYYNICNIKDKLEYDRIFIKRTHILNNIISYLNQNNMLPAICFVYSRKNVERFASEITHSLIDSLTASKIEKECRHILLKFTNYREYLQLPIYDTLLKLLKKGIGIHHSGMIPVFREIIELLFIKGYIKLLFATETFAVGLNMPTKTVLFTDIAKFDGHQRRFLKSHEYTQQAGRAGRRGFDPIGHVIHLANLFTLPDISSYRIILNNKPQQLLSKFKISYNLLLHMYNNKLNPTNYIKLSISQEELLAQRNILITSISDTTIELEKQYDLIKTTCIIPESEAYHIIDIIDNMNLYSNKIRKQKKKEVDNFKFMYKHYERELKQYQALKKINNTISNMNKELDHINKYFDNKIHSINNILISNNFIDETQNLMNSGLCAINLKELHCLAFTDLLTHTNYFEEFDPITIASILSCFTNIKISEDLKQSYPDCTNEKVNSSCNYLYNKLEHYYSLEVKYDIYSGADYNIHFDIINEIIEWCNATNEHECNTILTNIQYNKNIYFGEFSKAIIKINNITNELKKIAVIINNPGLEQKLLQVNELTLKHICTTQSLYI